MAAGRFTPARRVTALRALWSVVRQTGGPGSPGLRDRLSAGPRMIRLGLSGRYPHLDRRRLGLMVLALAYLVSPVDVVPEALLAVLGLGDDLVVLTWLAGSLLAESETFLDWERSRGSTPPEGSQQDSLHRGRTVEGEVLDQ